MTRKGLLLLAFLFALVGVVSASTPAFTAGGFEKAKSKANSEGKYLLVEFHAKWCTPCKWMDETTFADEKVVDKLSKDYVAVKMDIDGREGFELRTRFSVRFLPTILIFDSGGKMVERIEETMSPSKMYAILNQYESSGEARRLVHNMNTSPSESVNVVPEPIKRDEMVLSQAEYKKYLTAPAQSSYKMQMGVFSDYDGAAQKVTNLKNDFLEHIYIMQDYRDDKPLYRVIMGDFGSISEAESFRKILKSSHGLNSIII